MVLGQRKDISNVKTNPFGAYVFIAGRRGVEDSLKRRFVCLHRLDFFEPQTSNNMSLFGVTPKGAFGENTPNQTFLYSNLSSVVGLKVRLAEASNSEQGTFELKSQGIELGIPIIRSTVEYIYLSTTGERATSLLCQQLCLADANKSPLCSTPFFI